MNFKFLKYDIPSGIVVFLVALPLCLGISLASGAPFFSGIISGVIGGVVIGMLSGSNLSVSGPAAGLAALVLGAIHSLGDFNLFLCSVVIAGILQFAMGMARLGGIANYFPSSVIKGMLTSIGILIIAKQIPHAFGYDRNANGNITELFPFGDEDLHELFQPIQHIDLGVTVITLVSLLILILWERPAVKKRVSFVPGALVAVLAGVILQELFNGHDVLRLAIEHKVQIPVAESLSAFWGFFTFPDLSGMLQSKVIITGMMIAVIASLETLLSIEAVDNLDPNRQVTPTNRELMAQGIGNALSGLIGGLPITSVIVRSSANIQSGAKTRISAVFHGILLAGCVMLIPGLLNRIPLAALAAILLVTGYKLCKISVFREMFRNGKYQYIPFMVTVGVILGIDLLGLYPPFKGEGLLIGVVAGLFTAALAILHGNLRNSYYFHREQYQTGDRIRIRLSEEVSFLNKASIRQTLDHLPENSEVFIDASATQYIDFDVLNLIREFRDIKAPLKNIRCTTEGFKEKYRINNSHQVTSSH